MPTKVQILNRQISPLGDISHGYGPGPSGRCDFDSYMQKEIRYSISHQGLNPTETHFTLADHVTQLGPALMKHLMWLGSLKQVQHVNASNNQ